MKILRCFVVFLLVLSINFAFAKKTKPNDATLISHTQDQTVLQFNITSYDFEDVQTPNGVASKLVAPYTFEMLNKGAPGLRKLSAAVIVPDEKEMQVKVLNSTFVEIENIDLAPSKGNLLRTVNPDDVPYEYGQEYQINSFYPADLVELTDAYITRDYRGQAVIAYPFQYNPVTKVLRVYTKVKVKVFPTGNRGKNTLDRKNRKIPREFKNVYERHYLNYKEVAGSLAAVQYTPLPDDIGNMLIVCYSEFMSEMKDLLYWKRDIGYNVYMVSYSTIGSSSALNNYVADYYNTNGLTFLLLVGDHAQVPTSSTLAGDSDNVYGYIVGSDHYLDIFVGRFSAENETQVTTQVERTIHYERDVPSTASFFRDAVGMGSSEGPGHNGEYDYEHINNILADLAGYGYTTHTNHQSKGDTWNLKDLINNGTGAMFYCGHGSDFCWLCGWIFCNYDWQGISSLTNEYELPFIFSVACNVGNFKDTTCFCESWLRETNNGNPIGAVAHAGSTIPQYWVPPMDAQDEMADILVTASKRTFGGVFVNGLFKMIDINGTSGVEMADTWTVFGDPSLQLRTPGTPDGPVLLNPPIADFVGDIVDICIGQRCRFEDHSTNNPTSWEWTFEGGTPGTSTVQNPMVTYNTAGTYSVTLTVSNGVGSDTETKTDYITVLECASEYCDSLANNQSYEYIAGVEVGDLNNTSGASGYSDYTSMTANLTAGASVSVSLTPGFPGSSYTEYWKIWIDYNIDGDFEDSGEEVFSGSGSSTVNGSFTPPSGTAGVITRMRVSMQYSSYPSSCGTFTYGEVEDYTLEVSNGVVDPPVANFSASDTSIYVGDSVNFTDLTTNNPTSWAWTFNGGDPSSSSQQNPTGIQYNTVGTYDVSLTAYNSAGSDNETKYDYITVNPASGDEIAEAVDYTSLSFTMSGSADWSKVTDVYYYGGDSAKSGTITHNQSTTIETNVTVGSTQAVKFYWKVSSESNYDYLRFYIDGVLQAQISGSTSWAQKTYTVSSGTHTLKWSYIKDDTVSIGSDCGWVDLLELQ